MVKKSYLILAGFLIIALAIFLRGYQVTTVPPAPYWEEVALGYDAYSLLKTGADHHGNPWPIVAVESFGDWKPSGYFYALMPFIRLFGLNLLSVRLPSVISGVLIVLGVGVLLATLITAKQTKSATTSWLPLVGMLVTAVSPWAIQFSRAGWEVNLATCLVLWGIISCLGPVLHSAGKSKQGWQFAVGTGLLILSMYTYHSARVIVPLLGLSLIVLWISNFYQPRQLILLTISSWFKQNWPVLVVTSLLSLLLLLPLLTSLGKKETSQRFAQTSIFTNLDIIKESNLRKEREHNSPLSRILYHRYLLFGREIVLNYFKHFELGFLFINGDKNPRHSVQYMGQLYHIEALFLILGCYWLIKNWRKEYGLLFYWLGIGILPAAITHAAPHALRILPTLPVWMILITLGILQLGELMVAIGNSWLKVPAKYLWLGCGFILTVVYVLEFSMFWRDYLKVYPIKYAHEWQYGYEQMISQFENLKTQHPDLKNLYITREYGRPAMYYFFYTLADPVTVQAADSTVAQDQGEFLEYHQLKFVNNLNQGINAPALVAASPQQYNNYKAEATTQKISILGEVDGFKNQPVWLLFKVE